TGCNSSDGDNTATDSPNQPPVSDGGTSDNTDNEDTAGDATDEASLTITGRVVDEPISEATVTINLNGEVYTATADIDGYYEIQIPAIESDSLVRISATGSDAHGQGFVTL